MGWGWGWGWGCGWGWGWGFGQESVPVAAPHELLVLGRDEQHLLMLGGSEGTAQRLRLQLLLGRRAWSRIELRIRAEARRGLRARLAIGIRVRARGRARDRVGRRAIKLGDEGSRRRLRLRPLPRRLCRRCVRACLHLGDADGGPRGRGGLARREHLARRERGVRGTASGAGNTHALPAGDRRVSG